MAWTNIATLSAQLDPHYRLKLQQLEHSVQAEQYRAHNSLEREHVKANAAMDRERFRASEAWSQEQSRQNREDQREQARGQTALELSKQDHGQRLTEMEADLENRARFAGLESNILTAHKLIDEDNHRRASLHRQIEQRTQLRGEVFKMLAGAVIQEKFAQRQHARDMERDQAQSELRRLESYWNSVVAYLSALTEHGKTDTAKAEIDHLLTEWKTERK